jgi:hypothetical protein
MSTRDHSAIILRPVAVIFTRNTFALVSPGQAPGPFSGAVGKNSALWRTVHVTAVHPVGAPGAAILRLSGALN